MFLQSVYATALFSLTLLMSCTNMQTDSGLPDSEDYMIINATFVRLTNPAPEGAEREFGYDNFKRDEAKIPSQFITNIRFTPFLLSIRDTNGFHHSIPLNLPAIEESDSVYFDMLKRLISTKLPNQRLNTEKIIRVLTSWSKRYRGKKQKWKREKRLSLIPVSCIMKKRTRHVFILRITVSGFVDTEPLFSCKKTRVSGR